MVDIFDEVDEELRAERTQQFFKRYAGVIIAVAVLVVGLAGGWQGWRWWQARQDQAAAAAFLTALSAADTVAPAGNTAGHAAAAAAFADLASRAPEGYRTLARLREAALLADGGNLPAAASLWDQVAGDNAADPLLRELASLLWASRQLDSGDPALLEARLKPLASPDNAWHLLAEEQLALLALRQGKTEQAKDGFRRLAIDATAPNGVRGRASLMLQRLGG